MSFDPQWPRFDPRWLFLPIETKRSSPISPKFSKEARNRSAELLHLESRWRGDDRRSLPKRGRSRIGAYHDAFWSPNTGKRPPYALCTTVIQEER
jgi:hypothetical protein